jgi:hypothetical protein
MKNRKIKLNWGVVIIFLMLLSLLMYNILRNNQLNNNYKYTVAKVIKIKAAADGGGPIAIFTYKVNSKIYEGSAAISSKTDIYKVERKFYIRFYPNNPNNSDLTEIPYLDTLNSIPPSGWDRIPNDN